jgi:proteasome lid subunit RPN8/RPN11
VQDIAGSEPLHLSRAAWEDLRAHAERAAPDECCGLLIGEAVRIDSVWPAHNRSSTPRVRYELDPRDHFAAIRAARARGLAVVGAYHSHPRSAPLPSSTDRAEASAHFIYLIVGRPAEERVPQPWLARAFSSRDGNFEERSLVFEA